MFTVGRERHLLVWSVFSSLALTALLAGCGSGSVKPIPGNMTRIAPLRIQAVWQGETDTAAAAEYRVSVSAEDMQHSVGATVKRPQDAVVVYVPVGKNRLISVTAIDAQGNVLGHHTVTGFEIVSDKYNLIVVSLSTRGGNGDVIVKVGWADPPESFPVVNATVGWTFEPTDGFADLVVDWLPLVTTGQTSTRIDWSEQPSKGGLNITVDWRD